MVKRKNKNKKLKILVIFAFTLLFLSLFLDRAIVSAKINNIAFNFGYNNNPISKSAYVEKLLAEGNNRSAAVFLNKKIAYKDSLLTDSTTVLGQSTSNKWIEVDLSEQRLYMKEGDKVISSFLVSTGKWYPTPQGEWKIWTKLKSTRMRGGSKALGTFYDLPNVPYTMYYYQGYGIHGAYWHNNFGQPMSHGCVNMRPSEAQVVYNWAEVGTKVVVHS